MFRQKLTALLDELVKGAIFGVVTAYLATVEFQRGHIKVNSLQARVTVDF